MKLASLKSLTVVNVGGSKVTAEGAAAFQKALPQCRLLRKVMT
jgi:non-ribosomal peptide synthetase component E (peptide arylation enzyme)